MTKQAATLANFFIDCAIATLKGGIKTKGQAAMAAMFVDAARTAIKAKP